MRVQFLQWVRCVTVTLAGLVLSASSGNAQIRSVEPSYEQGETRALVALVDEAAALVHAKGEGVFGDLRVAGSRWRLGETYIFVLDPDGNMIVHPDPQMEGRNELDLKDVNGRPIIRGLLDAALAVVDRPEGWYHYQWQVPGALLPRWKSSYVRRVLAPSGKEYVIGSGMYNDRMERSFVVDVVQRAVADLENHGESAFARFYDPTGPYLMKDAYVLVLEMDGIDRVNPAFPNLEGRNLLDVKDTQGKPLVREMFEVVRTRGSGWVEYMWPKPGEGVSTQKSTYVTKAQVGDRSVLVGCGVYLADAPRQVLTTKKLTAPQLVALVRDGAATLEAKGEAAYPEFRVPGSKWFQDDTYLFVWTIDGTRVFHAADPASEGQDVRGLTDVRNRPLGKYFLEVARGPSGEGWIHYMYPEPGDIFPTWKSTFVKRVTFPSGKQYLVGSGIYNMEMDRTFIADVVDRAAALVEARGPDAFAQLRDKTGPFFFMDTYVFVNTPDGGELVNPAYPTLEGQNLNGLTDVNGKFLVKDYIAAAMSSRDGRAWVEYYWYKPGDNTPARKQAYVRKVLFNGNTYIVGSGLYVPHAREDENEDVR